MRSRRSDFSVIASSSSTASSSSNNILTESSSIPPSSPSSALASSSAATPSHNFPRIDWTSTITSLGMRESTRIHPQPSSSSLNHIQFEPNSSLPHRPTNNQSLSNKSSDQSSDHHDHLYDTSWAQQTELRYNLQLALTLRLVASAEISAEPYATASYFSKESSWLSNSSTRSSASSSPSSTSLRFWINGSLGYTDKIQDGFYHIWGMNPHIWAICSESTREGGWMPSLDVLRRVDPANTSMEVVLFDKRGDAHLQELENKARALASKVPSLTELAEALGSLVSSLMGGAATTEDMELVSRWRSSSNLLRNCFSCVVIPVGSISVGLCRHRALLYKGLADSVDLPCRIINGCKFCDLVDGASCIVLCGNEREFLVDLIRKPGELSDAEPFLKKLQTLPINSPLRLPNLKPSMKTEMNDEPSLHIIPSGSKEKREMFENIQDSGQTAGNVLLGIQGGIKHSTAHITSNEAKIKKEGVHNEGARMPSSVEIRVPSQRDPRQENNEDDKSKNHTSPQPSVAQQDHMNASSLDVSKETASQKQEEMARNTRAMDLVFDNFEIKWEDLILRERIGAGSFGKVHRADWHGSDVAVKILIEQDFEDDRLQEFVREVMLMKRMRHPNVVLFMGAVTKRPNLSIVTEYLPRGSLFQLLRRARVRDKLDEKYRIRMALDVARGMNYLHRLSPPIVHRDLKSPNLLVDKTWTVKVCDFGLSRFKGNTFLSSRSAAGTAEWMAPEVLRDEPSNEKSDVYSFGVILWELVTLQQPWNGLNPAQVVGAVAFQNRRLVIPNDINPEIAALIDACFQDDPRQRPAFARIMESLKSILKLLGGTTSTNVDDN